MSRMECGPFRPSIQFWLVRLNVCIVRVLYNISPRYTVPRSDEIGPNFELARVTKSSQNLCFMCTHYIV